MNAINSVSSPDPILPEQRIRERAYFRWLDLGCPPADDQAHWFWARQQLVVEFEAGADHPSPAVAASPHFSIQNTLAQRLSDPTHRFHSRPTAHDARLDVVAGEARQRMRGRHFDSSLRAQPKKAQ